MFFSFLIDFVKNVAICKEINLISIQRSLAKLWSRTRMNIIKLIKAMLQAFYVFNGDGGSKEGMGPFVIGAEPSKNQMIVLMEKITFLQVNVFGAKRLGHIFKNFLGGVKSNFFKSFTSQSPQLFWEVTSNTVI